MDQDQLCKLDALVAAILTAGQLASPNPPRAMGNELTPLQAFTNNLRMLHTQGGAAGVWKASK